ncbi:MAG: hypothetical protein KGL11_12385 [Alphaproteobacteria bacterium]|nr:hypothetical protein [Alphaproteobacteria bacterium]
MNRRLTLWERRRDECDDEARFTTSLAGLAATLLIGVIGLYVMEGLAQTTKLEDCLLQGRLNCERIDTSTLPSPALPQ